VLLLCVLGRGLGGSRNEMMNVRMVFTKMNVKSYMSKYEKRGEWGFLKYFWPYDT
jgi:hypothetical protein